jgi:hypothetical protein
MNDYRHYRTRWRRHAVRQRRTIKQMLGWGALAGIALGLVAQLFVDRIGATSDIVPLVRISLLFPAVVFGLWWLLSPELTLDVEPELIDRGVVDADERLRRIESTFDTAAVPRARQRDLNGTTIDDRARFRASIGIHASTEGADPAAFGVPRPRRNAAGNGDA